MGAIASQITSLTIVFSNVYLDTDQRKHHRFASLAFVWGIHRRPVNSPHKLPVTRKMFPFDDVIMYLVRTLICLSYFYIPCDSASTNLEMYFFKDPPYLLYVKPGRRTRRWCHCMLSMMTDRCFEVILIHNYRSGLGVTLSISAVLLFFQLSNCLQNERHVHNWQVSPELTFTDTNYGCDWIRLMYTLRKQRFLERKIHDRDFINFHLNVYTAVHLWK